MLGQAVKCDDNIAICGWEKPVWFFSALCMTWWIWESVVCCLLVTATSNAARGWHVSCRQRGIISVAVGRSLSKTVIDPQAPTDVCTVPRGTVQS